MFEKKTYKFTIVIPSWFTNDQDGKYGKNETYWFAQECLKKLLERTPREEYQLIIIDNGSTIDKESIESDWMTLEEYWGHADILIRNKQNLGFGPACNQGFYLSKGKYIFCLNNDIIVWEGWHEKMMGALDDSVLTPPVGIVMPALMKETGDAREALKLDKVDLSSNYEAFGPGAEFGSLWGIKRNVYEDVIRFNNGFLFDEDFLCGMGEDRFLWQQIRKLGYETYRTHKTRVFHQGNLTIGKIKNRKEYTEENRRILEIKKEKLWKQ